jgi:glycosyltransferase involved in cell wall biosynthesis
VKKNSGILENYVSIVIPTYNYGRYLREAIESALNQTYKWTEVIVVDDGSTDDTASICKSYPVKYFFQTNQGISSAMNFGISVSKGEFYLTMGADDILRKNYVEKTLSVMLSHRKIGFVYTGARFFGEVNAVFLPVKLYHKYSILIGGWVGVIGASLVRKTAFESVGGFDSNFPAYEDLDFLIRVSLKGWKGRAVYEPLYLYRRHSSDLPHRHPEYNTTLSQYCRDLLDSKYWQVRIYRKILPIYKQLFERFFFLTMNPSAYFDGASRIYRIKKYSKVIRRSNSRRSKKILELFEEMSNELYELMGSQVAREPLLCEFHKQKLNEIETQLLEIFPNFINCK